MPPAKTVDQYIRAAPAETQTVLRKVRAAVRDAAPDAEESISYGIPFYSFRGEDGVDRRLCYFGLQRSGIGFFLRPKDLEPHLGQLAEYRTSKSAMHFPLDRPIPIPLIKKLVRDATRRHRSRTAK